jgi:crotonobetainyl-CoA:carnitine CoA-transferase CaiB-like acyl-CoA transferase
VSGPLDGIRVVDLSAVLSGPLCTSILADQGADVVKVDAPGVGDIAKYVGSTSGGVSGIYLAANRGKRSIVINLQEERGLEIYRALAATADVVVQNFRPGVVERMGIGYDATRVVRPDVIYVSISGFGADGPYAQKRVYDNVIQAYSGMADMQSDPETGEPSVVRTLATDKLTGWAAAQAVTAALVARERGGGGQHVQLSMLETAIAFLWPDAGVNAMLLDPDIVRKEPVGRQLRYTRFADGWGTATPLSDSEFQGLCRALALPAALAEDPRLATVGDRMANNDRLRDLLEVAAARLAELPADDAIARLEAEGVPCSKVVPMDALAEDPQVVALGTFVEHEHPVAGRVRDARPPARFDATPSAIGGPAPMPGDDTDALLEELGFGERTAELRAAGIVA